MNQIRLTRGAFLAFVLAGRKKISAAQQIQVGLGMVAPYFLADFFDTNHNDSSLIFVLGTWLNLPSWLSGAGPSRVCEAQSTKN
jgi:hypothetical protein